MLIIYNPHVDDFLAKPIHFLLVGRRPLKKYGFLIDEARLRNQDVSVLVDGTASGLIPEAIFHRLPGILRRGWVSLEFWLWKKINNFGDEVRRVAVPETKSGDVLLAFSYKAATGQFALRQNVLSRYRAVIFHLSHYFVSTREKSDNIRSLPNAFLAGDSDIHQIPYFKTYFDWYKRPFLVLPFAVASRFSIRRAWKIRENRAVATGSFHDLRQEHPASKYTDFMTATGSVTYHPIRKAIYEASESLGRWIQCNTSPYREYGSSRLRRYIDHFLVSQKKYFSIDIVDLYNTYKFAVVGEELSGFPGLGALEAMASGCVLVAQPEYYGGLGLVSGQHYLVYKGSLGDLIERIEEGGALPLDAISETGAEFVRKKFSPDVIFNKWHETCQGDLLA